MENHPLKGFAIQFSGTFTHSGGSVRLDKDMSSGTHVCCETILAALLDLIREDTQVGSLGLRIPAGGLSVIITAEFGQD